MPTKLGTSRAYFNKRSRKESGRVDAAPLLVRSYHPACDLIQFLPRLGQRFIHPLR